MFVNIFIIWLVLMPLVVLGGYFESPKIFLFLLGGFSLSLFWVLRFFKNQHLLKLEKKDFWFWMWLLILTISSLLGVHPQESILGGSYRHQGVIFFLTLWLIGKTIELFESRKKRLLSKGMGLVVIAESLIVFYQLIFGKLYLGQPLGTLGEVNAVAGFLAIGSYFIFISFPKVAALIPAAVILLTQSRAGVLAFLPNFGLAISSLTRKTRIFIFVMVPLFVAALIFYLSIAKTNPHIKTFEDRQIIWPIAYQQIIKRPFLGYGAESGEVIFYNSFKVFGISLEDLIIDRAHNLFLDVAMWSGVVGLTVFSLWLYFSYVDLKDVRKKLGVLSFLIFSMFQPLSVVHWILLIIILGS